MSTIPKKVSRRAFMSASPALGLAALAPGSFAASTTAAVVDPLVSVFPRSGSPVPWLMPAHFGTPQWQPPPGVPIGDGLYDDVTTLSITYRTDEKKLLAYVPRPFELDGSPRVNVSYKMNREVNFLGGRGYNIISVSTPAVFAGKEGRVSGVYALVLWENLAEPILAGRETNGIPKIFGDIEDHRVHKGVWSTTLSNDGKTVLEMEAAELKKLEPDAFEKFKADYAKTTLLGWKYIPNEDWSAPMLSYATAFPFTNRYKEVWSAKGSLKWHSRTWEELPTQSHIVNALHALPVEEVVSCVVSKASVTLHSSSTRRLT